MIERCFRHVLLLVCLSLLPLAAVADDACLRLTATGNPEYPPYLWRDPLNPQRLIGANADLLKYVGKQLGLDIEVVYAGPWSRAQSTAIRMLSSVGSTCTPSNTSASMPNPVI